MIAAATADQLYLNAGQDSGVTQGMKLDCYRLGAEIRDPRSNLVIGHVEEPLGRAEVNGECGDSGDCAKAQFRATGATTKAGDICRLAK